MKTILLLALVSSASCTHVNRVALLASTAALACDWGQTLNMEAEGWAAKDQPGHHELNPVMGPAPSRTMINLYFLSTVVLNTALWKVLPAKLRSAPSAIVVLVQQNTVRGNMRLGNPLCGL